MHIDIRTKILKFVDHWAGSGICIILGLFHRALNPFNKATLKTHFKNAPKSILVIKFFGLGSILLSSSLLKAIKNKYPNSKLIFLTFSENAKLLSQLKIADDIRTLNISNPFNTLWSIFYNLTYFSFHTPAIAVDLEFFSKFSTIISYLSGAKYRVGFYIAMFWRNSLINVPVYFNYNRHILEIYSLVGKAIEVDINNFSIPEIPTNTISKNYINSLFLEKEITKKNIVIGVNVNASDLIFCRRWPRENFAIVINQLTYEHPELRFFLTGNSKEKAYTAYVFKLLNEKAKQKVFDVSGKLNFEQFIELLSRFDVFLTNDSGPFQFAKAQNTTTISIWGAGSPDLYGPYASEKDTHKVIYKRWFCSPCLYIYRTNAGFFCKNSVPCLRAISSQEVISAVKDSIVKKAPKENL